MFIEASETHESEISQMFLPTDNPLFFQLKVHSEIDNVLSLTTLTPRGGGFSLHSIGVLKWFKCYVSNQNITEEQVEEVFSEELEGAQEEVTFINCSDLNGIYSCAD